MKAVTLSLCILTGAVDVYENGVASVVVEPVSKKTEPKIVILPEEYLPPDTIEGDKIKFTVLAGLDLAGYCHPEY